MTCPFSESTPLSYLLYVAVVVGLFKITTTTLSFLAMIFDLYILPPVNFNKYGAHKGKWAVVTGASDGIGKEYARQIAKKGFNIVLISRTQSSLERVAKEIEGETGVQTKIVAFDASIDVPTNYEKIQQAIKDISVTILVNNVGKSHSMPVSFLDTDEKEMNDIMTINNTATVKITRAVAPALIATGCPGLIINMSSFAGLFPTPMLATYTGSKFFIQGWSEALAGELEEHKIDVECVLSYLVKSKMSKVRRTSATVPSTEQFVSSTLRNIGRRVGAQERYATITPYPSHAMMHWFVANTVGVFSRSSNHLNMKMQKSVRVRALRKAKRLAQKKD